MKNNNLKRAAAGAIALALVAGTMPANVGGFLTGSTGIVANAEDQEPNTNSVIEATPVGTAAELAAAFANGGAVQLTDNIELSETLNVVNDVTLDLNGFNITATNARAIWVKSGSLTLNGTGTISSTHTEDDTDFVSGSSVIRVGSDGSGTNSNNTNLTIGAGVTISSDYCYGITIFGDATAESVDIYGKVIVTGVNSAVSGNGTAKYGSTIINIYDGAVVAASQDSAIYHPQAGTLNITGGTISGFGGIEAKGGTINISGSANIVATGTTEHSANGNGTSTKGYAVVAVENSGYAGSPNVNISGGQISGPIALVEDNEVPAEKAGSISITGGTFNTDPTDYLAEGYVATENSGSYSVAFNSVATIGETAYSSLQAAIDAAQSGDTVKLMKDSSTRINIPAAANITLDLNGHSITAASTALIVSGKLTIEDSSEAGNGKIESTGNIAIAVESNSTLTINSGNITAQEMALLFDSRIYSSTVTINGGTFTTIDNAVLGFNGNKRDSSHENDNNTLIVNGGTFNGNITSAGYVACGIYCPNNDIVNVNGGTFNINGGAGIVARAGKVNVTGGTFNCTGNATGKVGDSRVVVSCSAFVFDTDANYPGLTNDAKITVSGGTFNTAADVSTISTIGDISRVSVSGGTFSSDVSEYVADPFAVESGAEVAINFDGTYQLTEDASVGKITVADGVQATLDLKGFDLDLTADGASDRSIFVGKNASLAISNSGSAKVITAAQQSTVDDGGSLTIGSKVTLTSGAGYTIYYKAGSNVTVVGTVANTNANDGTAISGNRLHSTNSILNISGTVTTINGNAIYHPQDGTVTITGGTITGKTAIYARMGNITISGGTLTGNGDVGEAGTVANGADPTGDALVLQSYEPPYGVPNVTITGGTFTSTNGKAIACYAVGQSNDPNVAISGGTFKSVGAAQDVSDYYADNDTTYIQDDNGKLYDQSKVVYEIINNSTGKKTYSTSAVTAQIQIGNETIKLWKDVSPTNIITSIYANSANPSVLDLNGFNVTCTSSSRAGISPRSGHHIKIVNTGANKNASVNLNGMYATISGNGSKLTIDKDVTVNGEIAYFANTTVNVYGTIKTTKEEDYALSGNHNESAGSTLNIYDGAVVESTNGVAIYHPQDGTLNIEGGTISGKTAVYARAGKINISGGELIANGAKQDQSLVANGAEATGDALVLQVFSSSYQEELVPNITGGTFTSTYGEAVATYQASVGDAGRAPIKFITGGYFAPMVNSTLIADNYLAENGEVKSDSRTDISSAKIVLNRSSFNYNSSVQYISISSVTLDGVSLYSGDYTIEGTEYATDPGTYVIKIKGTGNYKGEATASWTIKTTYSVEVEGDYEVKYYSNGQAATVTAPEASSGQKFSHWAVNGVKVSTNPTYSFIVTKDVTLTPVFVDVEEEVKEEAVLTLSTFRSTYNGNPAIGFNFNRSVPAGYTVKEVGLLYGTNKLVGANTSISGYANADLSTSGATFGVADLETALKTRTTVKKYVSTSKSKEGTISFTYGLGGNTTAYANAIGYVIAVDKSGKTVTLYSNAVATNFSSIN